VSEQKAEQTSSETGSLSAGPAVPNWRDALEAAMPASAQETMQAETSVESPGLVPGAGESSERDAPKFDAPKVEAPKIGAAKVDAAGADAPHIHGKVMIMSSGDRAWDSKGPGAEVETEQPYGMFGKRRLLALAAVVALAAMAGALGGALATVGLGHFAGDDSSTSGNRALQASVARIDADILALKASVEVTSKLGISQFNRANDRLDKVEKALAEPSAKLARLSEAVDKLRAAPVAAKEVTGSIAPPATAAATAVPKTEVARQPTVEGWVLRDVVNGGALIESRHGIYEVYAGDPVPGLGRVDAVRRQDGRWVVVTSKGLIVAR
jgi:hypothetical protein